MPESTSLLPEAPPRPCAAAICVEDDDALRRDEALGAEDASEAAEGGDPVAGLAEDLVLDEARALPTEGGDDRGEGETTRGLGWLVGAVRAFLGAAPAREAMESATSVFERLQEEVDETTPGEVDGTAPGLRRYLELRPAAADTERVKGWLLMIEKEVEAEKERQGWGKMEIKRGLQRIFE